MSEKLSVAGIPIISGLVQIDAHLVATTDLICNPRDKMWFAIGEDQTWAAIFPSELVDVEKVWFRVTKFQSSDQDYSLVAARLKGGKMVLMNSEKFDTILAANGLVYINESSPICEYNKGHFETCDILDVEYEHQSPSEISKKFESEDFDPKKFLEDERISIREKKRESLAYSIYLDLVKDICDAKEVESMEMNTRCRTQKGNAIITPTPELIGFNLWTRLGSIEFVRFASEEDFSVCFLPNKEKTRNGVWLFTFGDVKLFYGFRDDWKFIGRIFRSTSS
jgi:hypothetical protein